MSCPGLNIWQNHAEQGALNVRGEQLADSSVTVEGECPCRRSIIASFRVRTTSRRVSSLCNHRNVNRRGEADDPQAAEADIMVTWKIGSEGVIDL